MSRSNIATCDLTARSNGVSGRGRLFEIAKERPCTYWERSAPQTTEREVSRSSLQPSAFSLQFRMAVVGLVWLLALCTLPVPESAAVDIAILQSSDISAYREAIAGLKATGPIGAIYTEYDVQGDLELGKKLARKVRASNASLVVAVGLKA